EGGRVSEPAAKGITEQLMEIGFHSLRMKTGTPARIDSRSIDFSLAERQDGDDVVEVTAKGEDGMEDSVALVRRDFHKFSFLPGIQRILKPRSCYIVHTNPEVHKVLSDNLADSPLYNGQIRSIGPRYCPSIETKIVTFSDKESHQLFLEPEGESTTEFYINGFSSSLPWRVQLDSLRHVPALRDVHFYRPGYAIEYDYFDPTQLTHDLQTKLVEGLYFAGQVNGTTGYEEAAAQGLMAGINAALSVVGKSPLVLGRDQAYIGVLIDDLVTKGVDEPYRMFTSRAEYRILLRQDDADMRLTPVGAEIGLATPERVAAMTAKREMRDSLIEWCAGFTVKMGDKINGWLSDMGTSPLSSSMRLCELLKRPQLNFSNLSTVISRLRKRLEELPEERREEIVESAEILIKYGGYIDRERELAEKYRRLEYVRIPEEIDYCSLHSLSTEARQKLQAIRPATIGQASRIPGVSPADINILLVLLHR
ncbi:MAG: tRNA uridine-5-carboxymethylaminomethyl(34) synthesis enzyme MnmG, partial [Muribaculaceae bacterium]|nr:tRNA uridine-5-carboxymethylaminomethyl(34) synthesis enzyme MnmG [Muribaculaceae bacterium]